MGYSHAVTIEPPEGISFEVPAPTQVVVRGIDKQAVGEIAAQVRAVRPPEPYKGKGIRYAGEVVGARSGRGHEHDHRRAPPQRRRRVRGKVSGTAERPRLSVVRSNRGISAQLIDDEAGRTLAAAG